MKYYMIAVTLLTSLFFSVQSTHAQKGLGNLSFSAGYSLPVGKFANARPHDPLAGLAGSGLYGQINYDRPIWKWLGFHFSGSLNNNSTNSGPMIDKANSYAIVTKKTYSWKSEVSKWNFGAVLIGPSAYTSLKKLLIEAHIQAGIVRARTPAVHLIGNALTTTGQVDAGSQPIDITLDRRTVNPFGFGGGISLRYPVSKHLFIHVNSDILAAKAQVKNLAIKARVGTAELSEQISDKRFIGVVNIGTGIGISF